VSRLSLAYGVLFLGMGAHLPFFPLWLAAQALDPAQIGLVLALPLIQRIVTLPLMSALAGGFGSLKWGLALYAALGCAFVLLYLVKGGVVFIAAVTIALALVWMPMTPVLDALTIGRARLDRFDYGVVRAWGSVAFGVAVLGGGVVIETFGIEILIPLLGVYFALSALVSLALPQDASTEPRPAFNPRAGFRLLLAEPGLVVTLIGCGLVQASHAMFYGLGAVHWRSLGHSETMIGLAWGVGIGAEIAFLFVSGRLLARFGLPLLMALGCVAAILRWVVLSIDPALPILVAVQALHGLSFAATHIATVNLIAGAVPARFGAVAQGAYFAMLGGLNGAAFLVTGPLYLALQGQGFAAMAGVAVLAGALIAYGTRVRARAHAP
jgi:PPP family 3-phenylpropionic acid transporter